MIRIPLMTQGVLRSFILLQLIFQSCRAGCPNLCNQRGTCGTDNACTCYTGYTGLDCSSLICETGTAWADKATSEDLAHQTAECSNAGICDTTTGKCQCFPGYTGTACQRLACPNACNKRGQCMTIRDASVYFGRDYSPTVDSAGDGAGFDYSVWDSRSIQMCKCDYGFTGPDCSQIMCPKGDDPLTTGQEYRTVQLVLSTLNTITLSGELGISFHGETVYLSLDAPSNNLCTTELKASPQFHDLTCVYSSNHRSSMLFTFTFLSWPQAPKQNNLYSHDGNPPITDFLCDTSRVDSPFHTKCVFTDVVASNVKEYEFCSGRGICDFTTGDCTCVDGFGGMACQNITNRFSDDTNALIAREVIVTNPTDFLSTAVRINVQKQSNTDFAHIIATSNSTKHFEVRGDGLLGVTELNVSSGGITIARGGMHVESGGFTVSTDGTYVYSTSDTTTALEATSSHTVFTDDALEIKSESTTPSSTYLIQTLNRDDVKFSVRGDGLVYVDGTGVEVTGGVTVVTAGLAVSGGLSVAESGLTVTGGLTVLSGGWYVTTGLTIPQTGMKVTGGGTIFGGLTITAGGIAVAAGGSDISEGGLLVSQDGGTVTTGGLKTTDGLTVNEGGLKVTGGSTITTGGLKVTGGITVHDNGFDGTNGLTVVAGGFKLTGGLTVYGGAKVTAGMTIVTDGMKVANGASIEATGMSVVDGVTVTSSGFTYGAQVYSGGIKVTGGATIGSSGVTVTGGATVDDTGLYVRNSGATVNANGMKVVDGVTVLTGGVLVTGGVKITGGLSVYDVGMNVASGMTVGSGLEVLASGATISSGGMKVANGLTVHDIGLLLPVAGLQVSGGVSILDGGAEFTGGLTITNTGLLVTTDGGTITAGGLKVMGGLTADQLHIEASGLRITGGLTVSPSGMKITGGITYIDTGMIVSAGGMSVATPGLKITGGLTVTDTGLHVTGGGMRITGGLTLADSGIKVTGGVTISNTGLVVTANGVSITGGLKVATDMTVANTGLFIDADGFRVTAGLSIRDSSLKITGGLTLSDTGLRVSSNQGSVAGGMKVASGMTVTGNTLLAANIIISGSLSVLGGGVITSGLTITGSGFKVDSTSTNYIRGDSQASNDLSVAGDLNCFVVTTSDRRLKKEITQIKDSLDSVTKLRGVYFKWSSASPRATSKKRQMGLIAQDVQKLFPDVVSAIMDGDYLGVNYAQLIPVMIEAIRELDDSYTHLNDDYRQLSVKSRDCACRKKSYSSS